MRDLALVLMMMLVSTLIGRPAVAQPIPRRIASINLCTDQLLLALADPTQIASLSPYARDPALSFLAGRAAAFPQNRGSGENIVELDADLVLTGPFDSAYTRELLVAKGLDFVSLDPWPGFPQGEAELRALAARLGHPDRGEALIAAIENGLADLRNATAGSGPPRTSIVLQRRGFVFHAGLTAEIAEMAGLRDAASAAGVSKSGFVTLEALIAARPDYLIVSDEDQRAEDEGQALLVHPALEALYPPERRLVAPERLTICDGPSTPALIETLGNEIRTKVR